MIPLNPKNHMKNSNLHPPAFSHKLLRVTLAVAQIFSALSATLIGVAQPTLLDATASLQPWVGDVAVWSRRRYLSRVRSGMVLL